MPKIERNFKYNGGCLSIGISSEKIIIWLTIAQKGAIRNEMVVAKSINSLKLLIKLNIIK